MGFLPWFDFPEEYPDLFNEMADMEEEAFQDLFDLCLAD